MVPSGKVNLMYRPPLSELKRGMGRGGGGKGGTAAEATKRLTQSH